jgi:hypothetical protein
MLLASELGREGRLFEERDVIQLLKSAIEREGDQTSFARREGDRQNQKDVAAALEKTWECELHEFGYMSAIDSYATRHGRMQSLIELKCRADGASHRDTAGSRAGHQSESFSPAANTEADPRFSQTGTTASTVDLPA